MNTTGNQSAEDAGMQVVATQVATQVWMTQIPEQDQDQDKYVDGEGWTWW